MYHDRGGARARHSFSRASVGAGFFFTFSVIAVVSELGNARPPARSSVCHPARGTTRHLEFKALARVPRPRFFPHADQVIITSRARSRDVSTPDVGGGRPCYRNLRD